MAQRIALGLDYTWRNTLALPFLVACAQTTVTPYGQSSPVASVIPSAAPAVKPQRVLMCDFAVSPHDVTPDSAIGVRLLERVLKEVSLTQEQIKIGREVADALSEALVKDISDLGIPAERAFDFSQPTDADLTVKGQFITIDEGNSLRRIGIGLGAGGTEVKVLVQVYDVTSSRRTRLEEFETTAKSSRKPGIAETMPVGAAIMGVTGIATSGGMAGLTSSRQTVEADARRAAKTIAKRIAELFARQGWISSDQTNY